MSTYRECPMKWKIKYVDKVPEKPKKHFSLGSSVHSALEKMYRVDACPHVDLVLAELDAEWISAGYRDAKEEAKYKAEAVRMLRAFHAAEPPHWRRPLAVEAEFSFRVNHVEVRGFIDRVDLEPDGTLTVVDYKTGRELEPGRAEEDDQLTMYQLACGALFPDIPVGLLAFCHVPTASWQRCGPRPPERLRALEAEVVATHAAIVRGEFRERPSAQSCQWCDYKALCPAWRP